MASMDNSGPDWSFLNISDVDPKQNYNVVELNINGVMKKIMVPVINGQSQGKLIGKPEDGEGVLNDVKPKREPTPILIKPEEDRDLDDLGLQISNITSLSSSVHQLEKSSPAAVGRGRGQGRGRKMTSSEGITRTSARGQCSRGRPSRGRGTRGRRVINERGLESNRKNTCQESNSLKEVLCALTPENSITRNDNHCSTNSAGGNKFMLNNCHVQPKLAASQGKMLLHVQQNPDGSHAYKPSSILPSPSGKPLLAVPLTTSSSTGVSTTVTQVTSKPSGMASMEIQNPLQSATSQSIPTIINIPAGTSNSIVLLGVGQAGGKGPQLNFVPGGVNIRMQMSLSTTSSMITQMSSIGTMLHNTTNMASLNSTGLQTIIPQIRPLPVLQNMQNTGSQGALQVIQLRTAPVNGQPLKAGPPALQQNVSCSPAVNTPLILRPCGQTPVLFGTDGKPVNVANRPILKPASPPVCQIGSDQHVVYKSLQAGCQPVTQSQSVPVICSQPSFASVIKSTTSQSQQPTIVSGYFDSQGKFIIQQASVLPQGSPNQPIIVPSTSGAIHAQVQKVSTTSPNHVIEGTKTKGTAVKKSPEQLCQPLYLPASCAQPAAASPCLPTLATSVLSESCNASACTNQATISQLLQKRESTNVRVKCESNLPQQSQNELCITQLLDLARGGVEKRESKTKKISPSKDYVAITPASKEVRSSQRTPPRARKRSPPPPSRRQTDVNIGRERKIFPKGADTAPAMPLSVGVAPLYKSPGETASLMDLLPNSPLSSQQTDMPMNVEAECDSAIANCSIVELIKQDLELNDKSKKDDPTLHLGSLLKPCKVLLKRVDLKGQFSINLKHYRRCRERFVRKQKVKVNQPAVDSELSCISSKDNNFPQKRSGMVHKRGVTKTKKRTRGKYSRKSKY